jgi:hypothetical protein
MSLFSQVLEALLVPSLVGFVVRGLLSLANPRRSLARRRDERP